MYASAVNTGCDRFNAADVVTLLARGALVNGVVGVRFTVSFHWCVKHG